ncbi:MAG TPA: hypothetical protein VFS56_04980, partial [Gemmatimonadaceae bacterium]|nr:hypothetical protein [Gemmatimonadaceae bacterium]
MMFPLLQAAGAAGAASHPLSGTMAEWLWLLPLLPLFGFVVNGLLSLDSARFGPGDPNTPDHHSHSEAAAEAPRISHAEQAGAAGDDHHAVKRHRRAGVVSIVGPGVLILSFALALGMFFGMTGAAVETP